jgi:hypothetical protein
VSARTPFRYRLIVAGVLLAAFALFWGMRELEMFRAYELGLRVLGVNAITKVPFLDFQGILSSAACFRNGIDVFVTNPCDVLGRVHNYSPLWLAIIPSWLGTADTWWAGAAVAITFLLSLAWLCPAQSRRELLIFLGLCCSSTVVYATERANMDIAIFVLALIAGKIFPSKNFRSVSYAAILLAAALKFYPLVALSVLAADRLRRALLIGSLCMVVTTSVAIAWHREISLATSSFHVTYLTDMFSAYNVIGAPLALDPQLSILKPYADALTVFMILLSVVTSARLATLLKRRHVRLVSGLEETVLFLCGSSMIVFCFFASYNAHYRAILLMLTLPLLFAWTRANFRIVRLTGWTGISLVAFAVFENFLRLHIFDIGDAAGHPYAPLLAFWMLEQVVWWLLATSLTMATCLIILDLPIGIWLRTIGMRTRHIGSNVSALKVRATS